MSMSVCKMERHGRERNTERGKKYRGFFLQLLTTASDDMVVPSIYLTSFQYSFIALFITKSCAFLKSLLKISDSLQTPNALSLPESSPLPASAAE